MLRVRKPLGSPYVSNRTYWSAHSCACIDVLLTHLLLNKMAVISQTTFSSAFSTMKMLKIRLKCVFKGPIDNKSALFQVMAWCRTVNKPLPEPMLTQFTDAYMRHSHSGGDEFKRGVCVKKSRVIFQLRSTHEISNSRWELCTCYRWLVMKSKDHQINVVGHRGV